MKVCKKCGETAKPNNYIAGYYCQHCGNLGFDEVYSIIEIYKEWLEYKYLCMSPEEIRKMRNKVKFGV